MKTLYLIYDKKLDLYFSEDLWTTTFIEHVFDDRKFEFFLFEEFEMLARLHGFFEIKIEEK